MADAMAVAVDAARRYTAAKAAEIDAIRRFDEAKKTLEGAEIILQAIQDELALAVEAAGKERVVIYFDKACVVTVHRDGDDGAWRVYWDSVVLP